MIFLRLISCHSSQPTLIPPFTKEGNHYGLQLQVARVKVLHKEPSQLSSRSLSMAHTRLTSVSLLIQVVIFTLYMHQVGDTSLPKQGTLILYYTTYSISFKKHI